MTFVLGSHGYLKPLFSKETSEINSPSQRKENKERWIITLRCIIILEPPKETCLYEAMSVEEQSASE